MIQGRTNNKRTFSGYPNIFMSMIRVQGFLFRLTLHLTNVQSVSSVQSCSPLQMWCSVFFFDTRVFVMKLNSNSLLCRCLVPPQVLTQWGRMMELAGIKCHTNATTVTPSPAWGTNSCHDSFQISWSHCEPLIGEEQQLLKLIRVDMTQIFSRFQVLIFVVLGGIKSPN